MDDHSAYSSSRSISSSIIRWTRRRIRRIRHYLNMWVVLLDPRIVGPPLRVFWQLRRQDRCDPEAVNRACGTPRAYESAVRALEMSTRAGFYTFINAVADRRMVEAGEHERLYEFAARMRVHELRLLEPISCGRLAVDGQDSFLSTEHVDRLCRFHREKNRLAWGPKVCAFPQVEGREQFGCTAGTLHLYVDASGEVCPCDLTPLSFGNVLAERLDTIWHRMTSALGTPRCQCIMKTGGERVRRHAKGKEFPLSPEESLSVVAETPHEPLPDYFENVTRPFGFPK